MFTLLLLASSASARSVVDAYAAELLYNYEMYSYEEFLKAEKEKGYSMADEMKMSLYAELQDWQLKAIVKAAPDQMDIMAAKLAKKKAQCGYSRRRTYVPIPTVNPNFMKALFDGAFEAQEYLQVADPQSFAANQFLSAEEKENSKKMKKFMKKVDKMKTEELVHALIDIDGDLKKVGKKIKKISKRC